MWCLPGDAAASQGGDTATPRSLPLSFGGAARRSRDVGGAAGGGEGEEGGAPACTLREFCGDGGGGAPGGDGDGGLHCRIGDGGGDAIASSGSSARRIARVVSLEGLSSLAVDAPGSAAHAPPRAAAGGGGGGRRRAWTAMDPDDAAAAIVEASPGGGAADGLAVGDPRGAPRASALMSAGGGGDGGMHVPMDSDAASSVPGGATAITSGVPGVFLVGPRAPREAVDRFGLPMVERARAGSGAGDASGAAMLDVDVIQTSLRKVTGARGGGGGAML